MQLVKPKYLIFYNNCEDDNVGINMGCVCEQTKHIYVVVYSVSSTFKHHSHEGENMISIAVIAKYIFY